MLTRKKHTTNSELRHQNPQQNPQHFISNVGTNELCIERSPEIMAKSIVDVAITIKNYSHDTNLNNKANEVNSHLV